MHAQYSASLKTWYRTRELTSRVGSVDNVAVVVQPEKGMMSQRPARGLYPRLTHKRRASYGHALGLSDWRLII